MKTVRLPISLCHANCHRCSLPTEFKIFESGAGGDFSTYIGQKTNSFYRLDLGKIHYQGLKIADLLGPAMTREGSLIRVPEDLNCKICGASLNAKSIGIDGEEMVEAFEL